MKKFDIVDIQHKQTTTGKIYNYINQSTTTIRFRIIVKDVYKLNKQLLLIGNIPNNGIKHYTVSNRMTCPVHFLVTAMR